MLTVLLGGARSGKSSLAVEIATRGGNAVTYLATSPRIDGDHDLDDRIARHRLERPAEWNTLEEQLDLVGALAHITTPVVIIDCITTWVGNVIHHDHPDEYAFAQSEKAIDAVFCNNLTAIVVSNEVGLGIVPANEIARRYRDLLGRVNQTWAAAADHALFMVAGRAFPLDDPHQLLR